MQRLWSQHESSLKGIGAGIKELSRDTTLSLSETADKIITGAGAYPKKIYRLS